MSAWNKSVNNSVPTQHYDVVHCPCAVSYQDCALQMTLIMAMVTTTTMTTSVATTAMSTAITTLVVDLLQQLQLPQADSALAATVELHETMC